MRKLFWSLCGGLPFLFCWLQSNAQQKVYQTTDDPLALPYEQRIEIFNKGNLVPNPSFEKGSGEGASLKINQWQVIGSSSEWIDKTSFKYSATEVYDGGHSVRIKRSGVGETDGAEGICSDFISVIPGNYDFTVYLKLTGVSSATERVGTRLYDAVDLRLEFFDEQKKPIDPKVWYPYKKTYLDNSFKGYSFSNFFSIDAFGWGQVIGRTYNYPFNEGDLPEGTRYVKIFLGLKGNGTMWVDKVDFRYSRWNFTPLERISPFTKKEFSMLEMLVPQPQEIQRPVEMRYFDKARSGQVPVILVPVKAERQTLAAAQLLKTRLEASLKAILGKEWKKELVVTTSKLTDSLSKVASLIISIGDNELCLRYADSIPQKLPESSPQAYFIKNVGGKMIFLKGNGPVGDYYAVATLIQLIDNKDFVFKTADITDYPDIEGRSLLFAAWNTKEEAKADIANLDGMIKWKMNKVYVGYGQPNKDWHLPTDVYKYGVGAAGSYCRKSGLMDLAIMVNPYFHFDEEMQVDSIPDRLREIWTHGDPHSLEMLKNVFALGLDSGATCIMLMSDDYVPHEGENRKNYSLYTKEDKARFINLQNAQAYVINELYKWLASDYQNTRFEFCPPWYLNEFIDKSRGRAENYFTDLSAMIPKDVAIVWTGNTVRSLSVDEADLFRYSSLIGRVPMLWDNTLYARSLSGNYGGWPAYYPAKVPLCNIFEPYDVKVPEDFYRLNDGRQMYVNADAYYDPYKIKYMTVADFEWNNGAYDPDFSLWKALVKTYGKTIALQLMTFNDLYFQLMKLNLFADAGLGNEKDVKTKGDALVKEINSVYGEFAKPLESQRELLSELRTYKDDQIREYKVVLEKLKKNKSK